MAMNHDLKADSVKRREQLEARVRSEGKDRTATYENLLGAGVGLWETDEKFERFLASVREARAEEG